MDPNSPSRALTLYKKLSKDELGRWSTNTDSVILFQKQLVSFELSPRAEEFSL
jgi:hypothetical protein